LARPVYNSISFNIFLALQVAGTGSIAISRVKETIAYTIYSCT